ncbi:hypothetical protein [uncultured Parabacteroides sp.]|uniref:hypothetical protein n=2 Tax=Bacteroidales TaxID=171549 RepID=UPI002609EA34|nr:hypothetical protein [uncultured Parabacteroides sp.]
MNRLIVIAGAVVIIIILTIISVFYLPYGIGYMQTVKKHCENAKRDITSVEFTGEIVNIKKDFIYIKLAEPLLFNKVLPIEYPYKYDDKVGVLQMLANKTLLHYAKIGMSIDKMYGSDSIVVNNRSFAIYDKKYGRW